MNFAYVARAGLKTAALSTMLVALTAFHGGGHDAAKAPAAQAAPGPVAANTAVGTVDAFHAALFRADTTAALALLTDDVLIFESGGVERSKAEYAAHHLQADAEFSKTVTRALESRSSGGAGKFAWVTSTEKVTGTFGGRPINSRSIETMLLTKSANGWRISHIHWSSAKL